MTEEMNIVDKTIQKITTSLQTLPAPQKSLKIRLADTGVVFADALGAKAEDLPADTTIMMSVPNFQELMAGNLNPQVAYITGKIKIQGDPGAALEWLPFIQA